ncbi:hypothetical protein ACFLZ1_01585 [Patescibacteria group bacterium]
MVSQEELQPSSLCLSDCSAACCRNGTVLVLLPSEVLSLINSGTVLARIVKPGENSIPENPQTLDDLIFPYLLISDCGFLKGNRCLAYGNDEKRPMACDGVEVGDMNCRVARENYHLVPEIACWF